MPYEGEFAQYRSIKRIAESKSVKNLFSQCDIKLPDSFDEAVAEFISAPSSEWLPNWVVAVDGSKQEIPIKMAILVLKLPM